MVYTFQIDVWNTGFHKEKVLWKIGRDASGLEVGGWRLEVGGWRLEVGGWRFEVRGSRFEVS